MLKLKFGKGDWVVVCDGARAIFLENAGDEVFPNLRTIEARNEPHASVHEPHGEGAGRVYQSHGSARSAVEQESPKQHAEIEFLTRLAHDLESAAQSGKVRKLHIVASPKSLGILRHEYGHAIKSVLGEEVAKDLVTMPVHEIERLLTGDAPGTG
ncbi:MAG: host attachment protein [Beijerinckiaceae bacterium]|nr:host attachment protein [Beijerinckiaceae bacterium]